MPKKIAEHAEIAGARSALALAEEGRRATGQLGAFERRVAANPDDHEARYELATALNAAGNRAEAADALLRNLPRATAPGARTRPASSC